MTLAILSLGLVVWAASAVYAWRDWYAALCGLVLFGAVARHFPSNVFDVRGLNLWNVLFLIVLLAWQSQRRREGLRWDIPAVPRVLLWLGLGVLGCAFLRLFLDTQSLVEELPFAAILSDFLVNPLKWVVVGLLLFDGCRSRQRLVLGLTATLTLYLVVAVQVVRWVLPGMPTEAGALSAYSLRTILQDVGLHRNDVSVALAGGSWAFLAMQPMVTSLLQRVAIVTAGLIVLLAVALTCGRGGYLAWAAVGLTLSVARWRRYLLLAPLIVVLALALVPSVGDRALYGLSDGTETVSEDVDLDQVTSGRTLIWPLVIDKIWDAPFTGYGMAAMQRTGISTAVINVGIETGFIRHPHNAYLEMLLDAGAVGLAVTLALYGTFLVTGLSCLRDRRHPELVAVGGAAVSLVLAQLVGAFSGQTFWPRELTLGMWCAVGLLLRAWSWRSQGILDTVGHDPGRRPDRRTARIVRPAGAMQDRADAAWWRRSNAV
jgi:O-antigen ligase